MAISLVQPWAEPAHRSQENWRREWCPRGPSASPEDPISQGSPLQLTPLKDKVCRQGSSTAKSCVWGHVQKRWHNAPEPLYNFGGALDTNRRHPFKVLLVSSRSLSLEISLDLQMEKTRKKWSILALFSDQKAINILELSVLDTYCVSSVFRRRKKKVNILIKILSSMCYIARHAGNTLLLERLPGSLFSYFAGRKNAMVIFQSGWKTVRAVSHSWIFKMR